MSAGYCNLLNIVSMFAEQVLAAIAAGGREFLEEQLPKARKELIEKLVSYYADDTVKSARFKLARNVIDEAIRAATSCCFEVVEAEFELVTPGVWGTSSGLLQAALDVGLEWDYLLDLPVVRGSTLKGAIRSVLLSFCARSGANKKECVKMVLKLTGIIASPPPSVLEEIGRAAGATANARDVGREIVREVVGSAQGCKGLLVFLDAYPIDVNCDAGVNSCSILEPAILTPHYYKGGEPVEDEYEAQPVPIPHVAVSRGVVFSFTVAYPRSKRSKVEELMRHVTMIKGLSAPQYVLAVLEYTLSSGVMGARTARSYNRFKLKRANLFSTCQ